jgi:DNA-binding MarR family transcriptional regulator
LKDGFKNCREREMREIKELLGKLGVDKSTIEKVIDLFQQ